LQRFDIQSTDDASGKHANAFVGMAGAGPKLFMNATKDVSMSAADSPGAIVYPQSRDAPVTRSDAMLEDVPAASEAPETIARDVFAVQQIQAIPTLLDVLCDITGMRFAAVARVTEDSWTLCAVKDDISFGLMPGSQLDVESTLCIESKRSAAAIVIEHASLDPRYCNHHTPKLYQIESYLSVPIVLASGRYFGNLCAIDPAPAKVSVAILNMFQRFAALIAMQLENELVREGAQSALRDERASSELREQFVAILGHDLRNPLQAIIATSEVMGRRLTDNATLAGMASRIKVNAHRMSALIEDVLDFARGRLGGGIGLHVREVDAIEPALTEVVKELQDAKPGRHILMDINVKSAVRCDIRRVQQIASNLVGNALTYGVPESPVKVSAAIECSDFVFEVWNAGEPIPPGSLEKVFEPFWRGSLSSNRLGLGLGLYICSQIASAHGGTISVMSTREAGTRFTVRLPQAPHSTADRHAGIASRF